jgi:hypothetical protein
VDPGEAALRVLAEEDEALHWTVIQDLALRRGYLDPFETPNVRRALLGALGDAVRAGTVVVESKGVYRLA